MGSVFLIVDPLFGPAVVLWVRSNGVKVIPIILSFHSTVIVPVQKVSHYGSLSFVR